MNVGSLFSGIGGFDLGFERAGMRTSWFCEQDDYCTRVLNRHWPGVPVYPDVTKLTANEVEPVDVLCGGFPCQDLSVAGKGAGIDGARSGLWSEFARLIGELRPRYVVVENVPALLGRGAGRVLGDLSEIGYDAEWDCLPASAFGAPHQRDRFWLVAYPRGERALADAHRHGESQPEGRESNERRRAGYSGPEAADANEERWDGRPGEPGSVRGAEPADSGCGELHDPDCRALQPWRVGGRATQAGGTEWWSVEPPVGRVAHGVPNRLDQLAALGNALVPQIAEWIGRRLMEVEA